jgi:hypothetical protein
MQKSSQLIQDLDALYTQIVVRNNKEGIEMSRLEVCELIAQSPAPRLYISPDRALYISRNFDKYAAKRFFRSSAKHQEFYRRFLELPKNMRNLTNIRRILDEPAPSFYLSVERINKLLYKVYKR